MPRQHLNGGDDTHDTQLICGAGPPPPVWGSPPHPQDITHVAPPAAEFELLQQREPAAGGGEMTMTRGVAPLWVPATWEGSQVEG